MKTKILNSALGIAALAAVSLAGCYVYPVEPAPAYYAYPRAYAVPGPGYGYWPRHHYWNNHRGPGHGHW
jgi:hypothetical protein